MQIFKIRLRYVKTMVINAVNKKKIPIKDIK